MVKTYSQLYLDTRRTLMAVEDAQSASYIARQLLCNISGLSKEEILARPEHYASEEVCVQMDFAAHRILTGEPLAYVLGEWEFYGLTLHVDKNVLIPRDDTCAVAELAICQAKQLTGDVRILDLCTGSGCIGLAVASKVPGCKVTLADISQDAINVARKNISRNQLSKRVSCVKADALAEPPAYLGKFDLIVSNPPYITTQEMQELPRSVRCFEPALALHGGDDGLEFYRSIARNYASVLKPRGFLCFEFGMGQGDDVCQILTENSYTILERSRDYNDRERAVIAQLNRKDD